MSDITVIDETNIVANSRADINENFANLNSDKIETSVLDASGSLTSDSDAKIATQKATKTYVDGKGGTPALTLGTTNAAGSAAGYVKIDATVLAFDVTAPTTQAFGDSAAVGSATVAARRDHKHAMPAAEKDTTAVTGVLKGNGSAISACSNLTDVAIPTKAAGSDVTTGTDDTKFATSKALSDAGVNTRLKSKVISFTRDMTAASGDVAYTGVGFTPTSIIALTTVPGGYRFSVGISDSLKAVSVIETYNPNSMTNDYDRIITLTDGSNVQYAIVKSYDSNGFTLTWTKVSSPTGTAALIFLCFR